MTDVISIEETNQIRVSLGMKPLPTPNKLDPIFKEPSSKVSQEEAGSTLESRQAEGYENYRRFQEAEAAKKKRDVKSEAVKRARDAAKRFSKLEGKGLADDDNDEDLDVKSWLSKQKKRQKQIEKARKLEKELADAETAVEYTSKDLAGVKVGHQLETFQEGLSQVLTLKDSTIEENEEEGDELENLDLRAKEILDENLERKKKKPMYNPIDMNENGDRTILAQYDEEIDGKKGKNFTLNEQGSVVEAKTGESSNKKTMTFSLDILKDEPQSDYIVLSDAKIKKAKKKAKSIRQKTSDDNDIPVPSQELNPVVNDDISAGTDQSTFRKRTYDDISFVDDEDLQRSLATQRTNVLRKRQKLRPETLVQQLRDETLTSSVENDINEGEKSLVIDETSEFIANIQRPVGLGRKQRSVSRQAESITSNSDESDEDGDVRMREPFANGDEDTEKRARVSRESLLNLDITNNGLEKEATLDRGLGSTLKLLKDRGLIKAEDSDDLNAMYRQKQIFLAEKQRRETEAELKARSQRERDRTNGRLDRMSAREKEEYARSQNTLRDQIESRQLAELFNKEYKPNVELKYIDEFGRSMNKKEAFKHLSHQFHGKGSGKQKTEKVLKKIEDEKRRQAQSSLDGSQIGGMSGATAQQRKKQGQAGVRLA